MTVWELIVALQKMPMDATVITNCCEATTSHEDIQELDTVGLATDGIEVYVGSYNERFLKE